MKKIIIIGLVIIIGIVFYYASSPSYTESLEAKAYYEMGNYKKAYKLAKDAYKKNRYNNMAFTVLTQSKIAIKWKKFINDSDVYFMQINSISNKQIITKADKIKIKMMLEILIGEYKLLPHSKLLDKGLEAIAKQKYIKAKELYNGIFKK